MRSFESPERKFSAAMEDEGDFYVYKFEPKLPHSALPYDGDVVKGVNRIIGSREGGFRLLGTMQIDADGESSSGEGVLELALPKALHENEAEAIFSIMRNSGKFNISLSGERFLSGEKKEN